MNARSSLAVGSLVLATIVGLVTIPQAAAKGPKAGHSGGGSMRMPHFSVPRQPSSIPTFRPPKMSHSAAPARGQPRPSTGGGASPIKPNHSNANAAVGSTRHATAAGMMPNINTYTYGSGTGARRYRAHGYGHGYRNHSYGSRYGYGRTQGANRAIVARLRSVHAGLARLNRDYRGHRARAMHSVAMAVRQLTHRSMVYRGVGFAAGTTGMRRPVAGAAAGAGAAARRRPPMTQAQSDAQMRLAHRTLQGISMQLGSQAYQPSSHARAQGHIQRAMHEVRTGLAVR
jgi:hypothetical protein